MSKEEIGRIVLTATTTERNVRLTQEEGKTLAYECLRLLEFVDKFHLLCTESGVPQGESKWRMEVLRGLLLKAFNSEAA